MRSILKVISLVALIITIVPSVLVFTGTISLENNKLLMILGTLLWFASAPFWMNKKI